MCYNIETSIACFLGATISGVIALYLGQPILGCLILAYGVMQFSEILIWSGINTKNDKLNKIGTTVGKYSLPAHNIAIGIGILVAYWASRDQPKYWVPLIVGVLFYVAVIMRYTRKKDSNDGITEACDSCSTISAKLKWPYPHAWYSISFAISCVFLLFYVRPLFPLGALILFFFASTYLLTGIMSQSNVLGSYWCWSTAALAPLLVFVAYLLAKGRQGVKI